MNPFTLFDFEGSAEIGDETRSNYDQIRDLLAVMASPDEALKPVQSAWLLKAIRQAVHLKKNDACIDDVISALKELQKMGEKLADKLGIDAEVAGVLIDEGYTSLDEIAEAEADTLSQIEEFDFEMVGELQERAQDAQLVKALNDAEATEILLAIEGVDEYLAAALVEAEILTVDALAELAIVELLEIKDVGNDNASAVIMAARENEGWFD